ncbi:uncharacterized protein LOC117222469 isoform X2 [Megalopta genalis]|uniref:uncharacterized protein LOC117222469 isoform X2 n=1 Tax=Megalopta genalis TaxID=115081 RepID=UPI003FD37FB8
MVLQQLADFLSLITIGMCFILKIPQILNLLSSKSADQISVVGLLLELTSYTVMTSYNYTNGYSVLSYLEYPIILLQEILFYYKCFSCTADHSKSSSHVFSANVYSNFCFEQNRSIARYTACEKRGLCVADHVVHFCLHEPNEGVHNMDGFGRHVAARKFYHINLTKLQHHGFRHLLQNATCETELKIWNDFDISASSI